MDYGISNIIGHEKPIRFLNELFVNDRIPSGLLFYGQKNIGKRFVAISFAASVLCRDYSYFTGGRAGINGINQIAENPPALSLFEEENSKDSGNEEPGGHKTTDAKALSGYFCGKCPSCKGVLNGTNQNLIIVEPAGNSIKIEKINQVNSLLSLTPAFEGHRFVIIDDAQAMNPNAMNALLKILEEPPDKTVFILISSNINSLLPTIISRCSLLAFKPIPDEVLFGAFKAELTETADDILTVYSRLAKGSYSNFEKFASGQYFETRKRVLTLIFNEPFYGNSALLGYDMSDEFNRVLKNSNEKNKDKDNENKVELFEIFLFILRDIYIYRMTKNGKLLYNIDICKDIEKFIKDSKITPQRLLNMIELTAEYIDKTGYNLNKTIGMDAYFSDLLAQNILR
ncbi:MAG: hypothetical protein M0016_06560 [Deltaproteobacteria bacterium]|jgi:DNA polymerase-3 subunit delta'|nr:hypothetical protein [Deltaproteobacteria bacterium]MCL5880143.1 hypothetical protein [Deltaproteobacteria bacterium]MDA8304807.1 hypothetical protein [Deltaproteobacteria bacterium]